MLEIFYFAMTVASECLVFMARRLRPHCGYVFFTDRKVRQLKGELDELDNARRWVGDEVEEARHAMKLIEPSVENWVDDEQIVSNKARNVLNYNEGAQKACCYGWLPNPKVRYCLGKDASKTVGEIQKLFAQRNTWGKVYCRNDPPGRVHVARQGNSSAGGGGDSIQEHIARGHSEDAPPELVGGAADLNSSAADGGDNITASRASFFQEIMEALGDDKLKVIGVNGAGGVGKTTLLEEVEKKLRKEGKPFHMIVKAQVSQPPDIDDIQGQIADDLGLDLRHTRSTKARRGSLLKRLRWDPNEKILIILDNLLVGVDLTKIGIPSGEGSKGCKLLLTSRYNNVLLEKMGADRTFHLKGLEDDEAVRLFEKTVGDRLRGEEELKPIAAQVATKLAGLPLLIISIAKALRNSDAGAWRSASEKIYVEEMETIVQHSYDHLKRNDTKSLFLLCGLLGGTIQVETLLVRGMDMGLFENMTIQGSRDRLDTMLSELRSACLLLDGGDDKENVTIHDLYRDVVVSTLLRDQNSLFTYDEKVRKERTSQRKGDSDSFWSTSVEDEESEDKDGVGNILSAKILEPVPNVSPNVSFRRRITSWQKGDRLGSGSFGTVYEGFTDDGFFFAIKEVSLLAQGSQGKQSLLQLEQEISLLSQFEHENIVRYFGTDKDDKKLYIFLELMTKGSLATLYHKYELKDFQVSAYTRQILDGLKYLHDQNVVHRDIKCANILVDVSRAVKLADFGLAKATKMTDPKSSKGTAFWMAPEVVNPKNRSYGLAADIWSLGCTVLEMLTRRHPYPDLEATQALFRIGKGRPPPVPDSLSREARDFILTCLQVNPNDRPSAAQLLDHPFVRKPSTSSGFASPLSTTYGHKVLLGHPY